MEPEGLGTLLKCNYYLTLCQYYYKTIIPPLLKPQLLILLSLLNQRSGIYEHDYFVGGLMSAFLVDNLADKDLLEATKKRLYTPGERPPAVIHCKYSDRRHDIQRDRAQTNHPTLSDLINIDNDHVFNCIVDEVSICVVQFCW